MYKDDYLIQICSDFTSNIDTICLNEIFIGLRKPIFCSEIGRNFEYIFDSKSHCLMSSMLDTSQ